MGLYSRHRMDGGARLTLEMALVRVGLGAVFLEPKRRFMVGEERIQVAMYFVGMRFS